MLAERIEIIDIESSLIGSRKPFFHFEVEYLKSQSLGFFNFALICSDLDFEFGHLVEASQKGVSGDARNVSGVAKPEVRSRHLLNDYLPVSLLRPVDAKVTY